MSIKPLASLLVLFTLSLSACLAQPEAQTDDSLDETAVSESGLGRRGRHGSDGCPIHPQCVFGKHWEASSCSCVDDEPPPPEETSCTPVDCGPGEQWDDFFCGCVVLATE